MQWLFEYSDFRFCVQAVGAINISIKGYQMPPTLRTKSSKKEKQNVVLKKGTSLELSTDQITFQNADVMSKSKGWDEKETPGTFSVNFVILTSEHPAVYSI